MKFTSSVASLVGPRQLQFDQFVLDTESVGPNSVLVETIVSAISPGTELAAWTGLPPLRPGSIYPRMVGYCNVSRVIHAGKNISKCKTGDRVLSFSPHCTHYILSESDILATVPPALSSELASISYLFHLGYAAVLRAAMPPGTSAVILGLGVLGVTCCVMSEIAGWQVSAVSDNASSALPFLKGIRIYSRSNPPLEHSAQVVVVTSSSWADWDLALRLAAERAEIVVLGFPGRGSSDIPFNPLRSSDFYDRQLRISASGMCPEESVSRGFLPFNEKDNIIRIFDWFLSGRLSSNLLLVEKHSARNLANLYDSLSSPTRSVNTYLLDWSTF